MKKFFLILVAGSILAVGNGFRMSLGIYVPDLLTSTVFGASAIGLTYGIFNLMWGSMSPIAGAFAEQKGYVKTFFVGFIGVSLSFYVTSLAISPIHFLLGLGLIGGLSAGVISVPVVIGGVSKYFDDDKSFMSSCLTFPRATSNSIVGLPSSKYLEDKSLIVLGKLAELLDFNDSKDISSSTRLSTIVSKSSATSLTRTMYSCNSLLNTTQVVLYEGSDRIEMFLENKPVCSTFNGGNSIQGLVDATSTFFDIVTDPPTGSPRNFPLQWTAVNEGWEFIPNNPAKKPTGIAVKIINPIKNKISLCEKFSNLFF